MGSKAFDKWPPEYDFGGAKVLNLGCGFNKYPHKNVVNLDAFGVCEPDVVHDLSKPLPFEDESFDFIIANHIMEHVQDWWGCFNECARVLKTGGKMEIWVPGSGSDSIRGFRDHVHEINRCSFFGIHGTYAAGSNAWAEEHAYCHANRMFLREAVASMKNVWWLRLPAPLRNWAATHLRNVVVEQGFRFEKITAQVHQKELEKAHERAKRSFPQKGPERVG